MNYKNSNVVMKSSSEKKKKKAKTIEKSKMETEH